MSSSLTTGRERWSCTRAKTTLPAFSGHPGRALRMSWLRSNASATPFTRLPSVDLLSIDEAAHVPSMAGPPVTAGDALTRTYPATDERLHFIHPSCTATRELDTDDVVALPTLANNCPALLQHQNSGSRSATATDPNRP
jgi:hypothetical protein